MVNSLVFWAKLGNETWPVKYHPVLCHLIDVGVVASRMWHQVIRAKVREQVTAKLCLGNQDAAGAWLAFWAACHDIGKVSPCFQHRDERTQELWQYLTNNSFDFPQVKSRPHGEISTKVLAEELKSAKGKWPAISKEAALNTAVAVGGHHGLFPLNWDDIRAPLGNSQWDTSRRDLLAAIARLFEVIKLLPPCPPHSDDLSVWMYVAGLTSVADWIGSNVEFFPAVGNEGRQTHPFDIDDS